MHYFQGQIDSISPIVLAYSCNFGLVIILCIIIVYLLQGLFIKVILLLEDKNSMWLSIYLCFNMDPIIMSIISSNIHCDREKIN